MKIIWKQVSLGRCWSILPPHLKTFINNRIEKRERPPREPTLELGFATLAQGFPGRLMRGHGKRMRPTVSSSYCFICLKVAPISFLLKIKTSSQAKRNKPSLIFTCQSNVYLFKISELGSLFMLHSLDVFFYNKTLKTVWNFPWIAGGLNFTILVLKPPLQKCKIRYNQFRKL